MATVRAWDCSTLGGITAVTTGGTVVAGSQGGFGFDTITLDHTAASAYEVCTIETDAQTISAGGGDVGYFQCRFATAEQRDWFFGWSKNVVSPQSARGKWYSSTLTSWATYSCNSPGTGYTGGDPQVWVDTKVEVSAVDGIQTYYAALSDTGALGYDNFDQAYVDAVSWTLINTMTACGDLRSGPFYFGVNGHRTLVVLDVSLIIFTDDGTISPLGGGPYGTGASDLMTRTRRTNRWQTR